MVDKGVTAEVAEKLNGLPDSSAVSLRLKSDQYFDALQGMLDRFAVKRNMEVIYVTATIPSQSIISALEVLEIPMEHIWFVDCISQIMMSQAKRHALPDAATGAGDQRDFPPQVRHRLPPFASPVLERRTRTMAG